MKWTDNELDAHFKTNSPEIPAYDASFWKEMEPMLPKKPSKRKGFLLFFSAFGIITAISVMYLLQDDSATNSLKISQATQTSSKSTLENKEIPSNKIISKPTTTNELKALNILVNKFPKSNSTASNNLTLTEELNENQTDYQIKTEDTRYNELANTILLTQRELLLFNAAKNVIHPTYELPEKSLAPASLTQFYAQLMFGAGQSALKTTPGKSELLQSYAVGGGLSHQIGKLQLGFGGQFRMDLAQNIQLQHQINQGISVTNYQRIFSFDMPLSIGLHSGKWGLDAILTPGIQVFFSGKYLEYTSNQLTREVVKTATIRDAKSTTLEVGLRVQHDLSTKWQLGLGMAMDVIRPFNSPAYLGEVRNLPVHVQLGLRRNF